MNQKDFLTVDDMPEYESVRGVSYPVEPGMSKLRRDMARAKMAKAMRADDQKLKRLTAVKKAIKAEMDKRKGIVR